MIRESWGLSRAFQALAGHRGFCSCSVCSLESTCLEGAQSDYKVASGSQGITRGPEADLNSDD